MSDLPREQIADLIFTLIMILLEHEQISARELAERLEVSRRTIYRDIDTLNSAGLPIYTHQGAWGGVGLMKSYKVGKTLFTPQEIQNLWTGMQSYKQLFGRREIRGTNRCVALFSMMETAMNEISRIHDVS